MHSESPINSARLHPNHVEILAGDQEGVIKLWDLNKKAPRKEFSPCGTVPVRSVDVAPNGAFCVCANSWGQCAVWPYADEEAEELASQMAEIMMSENGGEEGEEVEEVDEEVVMMAGKSRLDFTSRFDAHENYVLKCVVSPDSKCVLSVGVNVFVVVDASD